MHDIQVAMPFCPQCRKGRLAVEDSRSGVFCPRCRTVYPIYDDIPFLFAEAAVPAGLWLMSMPEEQTLPQPGTR